MVRRVALPDQQSFGQLYLSKDFFQEKDLTLVKLVKRIKRLWSIEYGTLGTEPITGCWFELGWSESGPENRPVETKLVEL